MKKKYTDILQNLKEIDRLYFDIIVSDTAKGRYLEYEITSKNKCKKQINDVEYYIQRIETEINNLCEHNYIEDDIDVSPDTSQKIRYCSICEHTCKIL